MSEGSIRQRHLRPTKPGRFPFRVTSAVRPASPSEAGSRRARSQWSRRQARSCWRSDDRKVVRRRRKAGGESRELESGLDVERRRFNHGARRVVSERDVFSGARDVNVGCRSELEAFWRSDRGTPQGGNEARCPANEKETDLERGGWSSRARQRCSGQAKAARPAQAPWSTGVQRFSWSFDRVESRARGRRAGFRSSWVLTTLTGSLGPGPVVKVR